MKANQQGFTLIELMVVVTIIGVLASISISYYQDLTRESADKACAVQTKSFTNNYNLASRTNKIVPTSVAGACRNIATIDILVGIISATAKDPGNKTTVCNISTGACTSS